MNEPTEGVLIYWCDERGFGFLRPDDRSLPDVFVHARRMPVNDPKLGLRFEFQVKESPRNGKLEAFDLNRIAS